MNDLPLHPDRPTGRTAAAWRRLVLCNIWVPVAIAILYVLAVGYEYGEPPTWWPGFMLPDGGLPDWWTYVIRIVQLAGINITLAVSLQLINGIAGQFSLGHAGFMAVGAYMGGYAINAYGALEIDEELATFTNFAGVAAYFVVLIALLILVSAVLYGIFATMKALRRVFRHGPTILVALVVVWWVMCDVFGAAGGVGPYHLVVQVWSIASDAFVTSADGLAKAAAHLTAITPLSWRRPLTFLMMLIGGGLAAAIAGFVVGLPTLRLRGDYLAIATLGFAEIIRVAITNAPSLGGATGMSLYDVYWQFPETEDGLGHYMIPWIFGAALITILTVWRIKHSPKGRAIAAVREDEIAAAAIGVDPTHHKVIAFMVGAFFAGVAGSLYASLDGYLNVNSFNFLRSVELVVMVTLGGLGSIWGAVIVAVALTALPEALRNAGQIHPKLDGIDQWRMTIYALLLIAFMLLRAAPWYQHIGGRWRRWRDGRRRQGYPTVELSIKE